MKTISRIIASLIISVVLCSAFTGCNLIKGMGKDVEKGGEKLQDAAEDAKH